MKAQVSTEYLVIIGVILVVLIPLFYYAIHEANDNIRINEAGDVVNTLAQKADTVYALGKGTRDYAWVTIPTGIKNTIVSNTTLQLSFSSLGDVTAYTRVNVSGNIPSTPGTYRIVIEALDNTVFIGPVNDTTPPKIIDTAPKSKVTTTAILSATTDEAARCKYDTSDKDYTSMSTLFDGGGIGHTKLLQNLTNGNYLYYARCIDYFSNAMQSSTIINFTADLDTTLPVVTNTASNKNKTTAGYSICVTATATDNTAVDSVWAIMTTPFDSPLPTTLNYTLQDTSSCAGGISGDGKYGLDIVMQAPGIWTLNTAFANDTSGNFGFQNPYPNIKINVSANQSIGPGQGLTYIFPDVAYYFKTPNDIGFNGSDSVITLTNYLIALTDDDKNTPPSTARFYYTDVHDSYEGFIVQLNTSKDQYDYISIRIKAKDADILPYNLTVYAYKDNNNILTTNTTDFYIKEIIVPGVSRGFNEYLITNTAKAGTSQYIRLRIMPKTTILKKQAHITEIDFGVA